MSRFTACPKRVCSTVWRNLEKLSSLAIVILTVLAVLYAVRSFHRVPAQVSIGGIHNGTVRGKITLNCDIMGWPFDRFTVRFHERDGRPQSLLTWTESPYLLDTTAYRDGWYTVTAVVEHRGRSVASSSIDLRVDNTPPEFDVVGLVEGDVVGSPLAMQIAADPLDPPVAYEVRIDGDLVPMPTLISPDSIPDGHHLVEVTATDDVGNETTKRIGFLVDSLPPMISHPGLSNGEVVRGILEIRPLITEANAHTTSLAVDRMYAAEAADASPLLWDTTLMTEGMHSVAVSVVDAAGHRAEALFDVLVDNDPETIRWGSMQIGWLRDYAPGPWNPYEPTLSIPILGIEEVDLALLRFGETHRGLGLRFPLTRISILSATEGQRILAPLLLDLGGAYGILAEGTQAASESGTGEEAQEELHWEIASSLGWVKLLLSVDLTEILSALFAQSALLEFLLSYFTVEIHGGVGYGEYNRVVRIRQPETPESYEPMGGGGGGGGSSGGWWPYPGPPDSGDGSDEEDSTGRESPVIEDVTDEPTPVVPVNQMKMTGLGYSFQVVVSFKLGDLLEDLASPARTAS